MGKQYDKVIKRRRRLAYLERRKEKAKEAARSELQELSKNQEKQTP